MIRSSKKPTKESRAALRVGVDTGGTFTDFVYHTGEGFRIFKVASTPEDPALAITQGLREIVAQVRAKALNLDVVHGTTVGTNALLQRKGAQIALVTTKGFEDVIEIGRQARPELYNLNAIKPPALVRSELRFGIDERLAANGEVLVALRHEAIEQLTDSLRASRCEAVAVSLLFSFVDPRHEDAIGRSLKSLGVPVSISHEILPEYREYERTATVCVNAYLQPLMGRYLSRLAPSLKSAASNLKLRVMQSSGGSISADIAAQEPVRTILSGPAGGIVGALHAARATGIQNIITFDMGGTSTDVALCDREGMRLTNESVVAGVPVAVPMMDIHTVGAGGGSIARIDEGGSLRVGPESAGAAPGPACYGRSNLATVTDAHAVLGHFPGGSLLDGDFRLDESRARAALESLATEMSKAAARKVTAIEAAHGVLDVVTTNMERALRHISVERGYDPREFTLIPFGGAGGLHAVALARALRIPRVMVPTSPGALSAMGVLTADVVKEQTRTVMLDTVANAQRELETAFREMEKEARATLRREGFPEAKQKHERSLAARYKGQSFELQIKQTTGNIAAAFHRAHRARYGYAQEQNIVEIVSARVRSIGLTGQFKTPRVKNIRAKKLTAPHYESETHLDAGKVRTSIYRREQLKAGARLRAPCIVTEYSATTIVPKSSTAFVDERLNLIIDV